MVNHGTPLLKGHKVTKTDIPLMGFALGQLIGQLIVGK